MAEIKLMQGELETLNLCRNKAREVARLERRVNSPLPTAAGLYKSPSFSGMPGARDAHGLDGSMRRNEADFEAYEREQEALEEMREAAMRVILMLDPKMHDFCVEYYINGQDMAEVSRIIDRDRTTCWRMRQKLHGGHGNFRRVEMQQNATKCNIVQSVKVC